MSISDELRELASGPAAQNPENIDALNLLCRAADEIERLSVIVRRLPTTADGWAMMPGVSVWYRNQFNEIGQVEVEMTFNGDPLDYIAADQCYSTQEAAEAARETVK